MKITPEQKQELLNKIKALKEYCESVKLGMTVSGYPLDREKTEYEINIFEILQ